jgi:hypothetical protein
MSKAPPPLTSSPEEDACAICLDVISTGEQQQLSCGHSDFHEACIEKWLLNSEQCPKCRAVVRHLAEDEDEEQRRLVLLVAMRHLLETEVGWD